MVIKTIPALEVMAPSKESSKGGETIRKEAETMRKEAVRSGSFESLRAGNYPNRATNKPRPRRPRQLSNR